MLPGRSARARADLPGRATGAARMVSSLPTSVGDVSQQRKPIGKALGTDDNLYLDITRQFTKGNWCLENGYSWGKVET